MKTRFNPVSGFSLIELLVVIAIIAVLAALLFPVFNKALEKARQATCLSNLHQIGLAVDMYNQDYDGYFPYAISPVEENHNFWGEYSPSFAAQVPFLPQFHVVMQPYIKSKEVFHCPSDVGFDSYHWPLNDVYYFLDAPEKAYPSAYVQWGTSYDYRTELAEGMYSDTSLQDPANSLVLSDMVGTWHGLLTVPQSWYDCLFADYHVKVINGMKVRNYQVNLVVRN